MKRCSRLFAYALVGSLVTAVPSIAQDEEEIKKDLTSVIALHGLPCGEVVAVKVQAQNDYLASCKDGNRYHVYENDKGRVVVEKQ
jgi:hypothetical protein